MTKWPSSLLCLGIVPNVGNIFYIDKTIMEGAQWHKSGEWS